jgi:DHA1 family bicyclomycin/chloramphenicol resistance-like MFS transporter
MHAHTNRPTLGFILLAGSLTAFGAVSIDFYLPALPAIAEEYGASTAAAQLTMSAFLAGMAIGQLGFGPLSDRIGRRPPLLAGTLLYTLVSLALAFAPSIEMLAFGRFVQGLVACAGVVIARAIIRDRFDTTESARLFSLTFLVLAIAPMLAPTVGAGLMALFGWHSIFLVLALFGLLVTLAVFFRLPESRTAETAAQAASESPLESYRAALADRRVLGFVGAGALNGASLFTYVAGSPALFISHFGQPPSAFGWIFALNALGLIIATQLNRHLLKRVSPHLLARRGALAAMGFSALLLGLAAAGLADLSITMILLFLGLGSYGFVSSNSSALALGAMPQRAGAISALIGAGSFTFGAVASALTAPFAADGPLAIAAGMAIGFAGSAACIHLVARSTPRG